MAYKPFKLDRDIYVDRTKIALPEDIILNIPTPIRIQTTNTFIIENYNPRDEYTVTFDHGEWTHEAGVITYTAPLEYYGPLQLSIRVRRAPFRSFVIFEDGTLYNEYGEVDRAYHVGNGVWEYDFQFSDYEEDYLKFFVPPLPPPFPTTNPDHGDVMLGDFDPSRMFGSGSSHRYNPELAKFKKGNIMDYFLPSELNSRPDNQKYLYNVITESDPPIQRFVSVPRNSNVTEAHASGDGSVFEGYREPGAVGGSLSVKMDPEQLESETTWDLEILLWDLEAVLPDEIISLCITSLELTPVLRGLETGHTYLWEQISGDQSTVTWLTPKDQKDVVIDLGGLKVDRVFRFWISKGTRYEKFYDVYLYGTPFDRVVSGPNVGMGLGVNQRHLNIKVHECSPILLSYQNIWNKQLRIQVMRNY